MLLYVLVLCSILIGTGIYLTRYRWLPHVPEYLYSRVPSSFAGDIEEGLTSEEFDLHINVAGGDTRAGLDPTTKKEIKKIMRARKVNFDEARRLHMEGRFAKNNIGPDGRPQDPRLVSFS